MTATADLIGDSCDVLLTVSLRPNAWGRSGATVPDRLEVGVANDVPAAFADADCAGDRDPTGTSRNLLDGGSGSHRGCDFEDGAALIRLTAGAADVAGEAATDQGLDTLLRFAKGAALTEGTDAAFIDAGGSLRPGGGPAERGGHASGR